MKNTNTKTLTRVALLVAIELVMKLVGLGSVPVGPLYMSFLTLPIAVGAITMGPAVGALLGGVFGGDQGMFPAYVHGICEKDGLTLAITSRLGSQREAPPRFRNPPESMVLDLLPEN